MKNASVPATVLIFILAIAAGVFAGIRQTERPSLEGRRFVGAVVVADDTTKTLVVRSRREEMVFDVSSTRIFGKWDLQGMEVGERVFVRYVEEGNKNVATSIIEATHRWERKGRTGSGARATRPDDEPEKK